MIGKSLQSKIENNDILKSRLVEFIERPPKLCNSNGITPKTCITVCLESEDQKIGTEELVDEGNGKFVYYISNNSRFSTHLIDWIVELSRRGKALGLAIK
jgi:hypothetical protein